MKKQILILVASLVLASDLTASECVRGEYFFRPTFQKKLKRMKPIGLHSFKPLGLKQTRVSQTRVLQKGKKKEVFIDWRKLYWGKLSDIIYSAEEFCDDGVQGSSGREGQNLSADTEDSQAFAKELRQELKSFAKRYGLKIVWWKKSLDLVDGTAAFLEYWDKDTCVPGFPQEKQGKVVSFDDLCSLSAKHTGARDTSVRNATIKDTSAKEIKTKGTSAQNPFPGKPVPGKPAFTNMLFSDFLCGYVPFANVPFVSDADEPVLLKEGV